MNYLQPSEYELYGLEGTTDVAWITAASALIDSHCARPSLALIQYMERLLTDGQRPVQLTYLPMAALAPATTPFVSARARYAMPRRGELPDEELAFDAGMAFGIPGSWVDMDVSLFDCMPDTGVVTVPLNIFAWAYNELEITYTAGWTTIPDPVKVACAQLAKNAQSTPGLNVKKGVMNNMQLWYFKDSLLDQTVTELLAPYVARKVG
ncbi:MAG TPA: hypothetical protein VMT67_06085 [Terriglobales bacterium]|nr:hypothetical protein [Terriglobales bacterium]